MLIIRGVNIFPTQIEAKLVAIPVPLLPLPNHSDAGRQDGTIWRFRSKPALKPPLLAKDKRPPIDFSRLLKETIGVTAHVNIVDPEALSARSAKPNASSIADQRNNIPHGTLSRQRLRRKTTIFNRSAELFSEHGYDRASMNKITESCGVSKANLYHYYKDNRACYLTSYGFI